MSLLVLFRQIPDGCEATESCHNRMQEQASAVEKLRNYVVPLRIYPKVTSRNSAKALPT